MNRDKRDVGNNVCKAVDNLVAQFKAAGIVFDRESAILQALEDTKKAAFPPEEVPEPIVLVVNNEQAKLLLGLLSDEVRFPGGDEESATAKTLYDAISGETYEEWEYEVGGTRFRRTAKNRISALENGAGNIHFWFAGGEEGDFRFACNIHCARARAKEGEFEAARSEYYAPNRNFGEQR